MFSQSPVITPAGNTLLLRAASGEQITFTRFKAGDGILTGSETPESRTTMKHVVLDNIPITASVNTDENGFIELSGAFDNSDIQTEFVWRELGVFAEDEEGNEYMYAYGYEPEYAEMIRSTGSVSVEQSFTVLIYVGTDADVTVYVLPNASWATKQEFQAHVAARNPHHTLPSDIGAAAEEHTHDAATDITEGILPVERGGTGVDDLSKLGIHLSGNYVIGSYVGDGKIRQDITLGFTPTKVILMQVNTTCFLDNYSYIYMFAPGMNIFHKDCGAEMQTADANTLLSRGHGGAAVIDGGFAVGFGSVTATYPQVNNKDKHFMYIAFR